MIYKGVKQIDKVVDDPYSIQTTLVSSDSTALALFLLHCLILRALSDLGPHATPRRKARTNKIKKSKNKTTNNKDSNIQIVLHPLSSTPLTEVLSLPRCLITQLCQLLP